MRLHLFLKIILLLAMAKVCLLAADESEKDTLDRPTGEEPPASSSNREKGIKMRYKSGDWRPHFGYVRGHYASDHKKRRGNKNIDIRTQPAAPVDTSILNRYIVRLLNDNKVIGSGLIVDADHVLVSTLSVFNVAAYDIEVKLADGSQHLVYNSSLAGDYTLGMADELLTLLEMEELLPEEYQSPAPICSSSVPADQSVELWEWNRKMTFLNKLITKPLTNDVCKELINDREGKIINDTIICLENKRVTKDCENTLGMPFVWQNQFCGMNIMGHNCPNASRADVFVKLLTIKSFIMKKLNEVRVSNLEDDIF